MTRTWTRELKTDQVTYEGKNKSGNPVKVTYLRSQLGSQPAELNENIDPAFVNDQYWLILPFHVSWDTSVTVEDTGRHKLQLGKGTAEKVVVKYPAEGGYSSDDTWDLSVGADARIQEMVYHRGAPKKSGLVTTTWVDYKKGWTAASLAGSPRHGRRQAGAHFLLECGHQAGRLDRLDRRAITE